MGSRKATGEPSTNRVKLDQPRRRAPALSLVRVMIENGFTAEVWAVTEFRPAETGIKRLTIINRFSITSRIVRNIVYLPIIFLLSDRSNRRRCGDFVASLCRPFTLTRDIWVGSC